MVATSTNARGGVELGLAAVCCRHPRTVAYNPVGTRPAIAARLWLLPGIKSNKLTIVNTEFDNRHDGR
jgi:hypothetical protein